MKIKDGKVIIPALESPDGSYIYSQKVFAKKLFVKRMLITSESVYKLILYYNNILLF